MITKNQVLDKIANLLLVIKECPELFHDGIEEDIIYVLNYCKRYIESEK